MQKNILGKKWRAYVSELIREQRWKFLVIGFALMVLGFKLSLTPPETHGEFALDYVRDNDWDVITARSVSFVFMVIAVIGFKSKFDRVMFPRRYKSRGDKGK